MIWISKAWNGIQMGKELIKQEATWIMGPSSSIKALKAKLLLEVKGFIPQLKPWVMLMKALVWLSYVEKLI